MLLVSMFILRLCSSCYPNKIMYKAGVSTYPNLVENAFPMQKLPGQPETLMESDGIKPASHSSHVLWIPKLGVR